MNMVQLPKRIKFRVLSKKETLSHLNIMPLVRKFYERLKSFRIEEDGYKLWVQNPPDEFVSSFLNPSIFEGAYNVMFEIVFPDHSGSSGKYNEIVIHKLNNRLQDLNFKENGFEVKIVF